MHTAASITTTTTNAPHSASHTQLQAIVPGRDAIEGVVEVHQVHRLTEVGEEIRSHVQILLDDDGVQCALIGEKQVWSALYLKGEAGEKRGEGERACLLTG